MITVKRIEVYKKFTKGSDLTLSFSNGCNVGASFKKDESVESALHTLKGLVNLIEKTVVGKSERPIIKQPQGSKS